MAIATETLAMGTLTTWAGTVRATASAQGLREVWLPRWGASATRADGPAPEAQVKLEETPSTEATERLRTAFVELAEYFAGKRREFTVALDLRGSGFFQRVWAEVVAIPWGETRTYQEIARQVGVPGGPRAVGAANGANPVAPIVPCHRVLGSDGHLTGYGSGLSLKHALLLHEDAIPAGEDAYAAWTQRVTRRLRAAGNEHWYLGIRRLGIYCWPDCPRGGHHRHAPNRLLRSTSEAAEAGFQPCPACQLA